jgi:hypothetical protein
MKVQFVIWLNPEQGEVPIGPGSSASHLSGPRNTDSHRPPRHAIRGQLASETLRRPHPPRPFLSSVFLCATVFVSFFFPSYTHREGVALHNQCQKCHTKRVQQLALQRTGEPLAKSPAVSSCHCLQGAEPGMNLAEADGDIGPAFLSLPPPPPGTLSQLKICPFSNTLGSCEDPLPGEGYAGPRNPRVTTGTRRAPGAEVMKLREPANGQQRRPAVPRMRGLPRPRSRR